MQSFEMPKVTFQEYDKAIMLSPLTLKILTSDKRIAGRFLSISQNNLREHNLCHQISKRAAFCRNMRMTVKMSKQFQGERNQVCSMAEKSSNSKRRDIFAIHYYKIGIILSNSEIHIFNFDCS